jgi:hypothetical protein
MSEARGEQTRAQFMSGDGRDLYNQWVIDIMEATVTAEFLEGFPDRVQHSPLSGRYAPPIASADSIVGAFRSALEEVDHEQGITRRILLPASAEVDYYTSAKDSTTPKKETDTERLARYHRHIHDSNYFGMSMAASTVYDNYFVRYRQAVAAIREQDISNDLSQLQETMGTMWVPEYMVDPPHRRAKERTLDVQKLGFIGRSLVNPATAISLGQLTKAGFNVYSGAALYAGDAKMMTAGKFSNDGPGQWYARAQRVGFKKIDTDEPFAIMPYDEATQTFSVREDVIAALRATMSRQNKKGLNRADKVMGGSINKFRRNVTVGCPVDRGIAVMAEATGRLFIRMADHYRETVSD